MEKTKTLRETLDKILEKIDDTNIIKEIGGCQVTCDEIDKEYEELSQKHLKLAADYKEQVRKGVFNTHEEGTPKEDEKPSEVSFENIANDLLNKQEDK